MKKLSIFMIFAFVAVASADQYSKWLDEEVKVLITKQEKDAFKKLKTDQEKQQFITDFWAKRDPSPNSPTNEFKDFYEANLKFVKENLKMPVDSDVGEVYLLLGNPTQVKEEGTEDPKDRILIYQDTPKGVITGEVQIKLSVNEDTGKYEFFDSKKTEELLEKARDYYAQLSANAGEQTAASASASAAQHPAAPSPAAPSPAALPPVVTPEVKSALDAAVAGNPPVTVPVKIIVDSFMTSTGESFVTVAADSTADVSAAKIGIRVLDSSGAPVEEEEKSFASIGERPGYFQTSMPLPPGDYTVAVGVAAGAASGGAKQTFKVPDRSSALTISSLIISKAHKVIGTAAPEMEPYTFGKIKMEPSIDHVFSKNEEMTVAYEVYDFQVDPATGNPNLEVTISFQREGGKLLQAPPEPLRGLVTGKKINTGTTFALNSLAPGKQKLTISVTDKLKNQTASQEASFELKE
jgi:GWxTD domain-containing protein